MLEHARIGDFFKTRDGRKVEYRGIEVEGIHIVKIDNNEYYALDSGSIFDPFGYNPPESDYDLISKYDS